MNYFRYDNTDGYDTDQLATLNDRLIEACETRGLDTDPASTDADVVQAVAERILTAYDNQK